MLKLGDVLLNRATQYKYLGTAIDEKLNGEAQFNNISQVLSHRKQSFSKIIFLTAESLFERTIQPIFDYNDYCCNIISQEKQDKLQNKVNTK